MSGVTSYLHEVLLIANLLWMGGIGWFIYYQIKSLKVKLDAAEFVVKMYRGGITDAKKMVDNYREYRKELEQRLRAAEAQNKSDEARAIQDLLSGSQQYLDSVEEIKSLMAEMHSKLSDLNRRANIQAQHQLMIRQMELLGLPKQQKELMAAPFTASWLHGVLSDAVDNILSADKDNKSNND